MGTSTSQGSPNTPNWNAAFLAYKYDSVPIWRAVEEIWLAASKQSEGNLATDLQDPIFSKCLKITLDSKSREEALSKASMEIALSSSSTLATDIALRAIVKSFSRKEERISAFTTLLFKEASDYLVSRDLPAFIGKGGRAETIIQAIEFKTSLLNHVTDLVANIQHPHNLFNERNWKIYINDVVKTLSGQKSNE